MWRLAVFSQCQHEQFCGPGPQLALVRPSGSARWRPSHSDPDRGAGVANAITLRIVGAALVIDCHGRPGTIELATGETFTAAVPTEAPLPCTFRFEEAWFEVRQAASDLAALMLQPLAAQSAASQSSGDSPASSPAGPHAQTIARWLKTAGQLHRTAANSPEFYPAAARLALEATGLDVAMILAPQDGQWQIVGSAVPQPQFGITFEPAVLDELVRSPGVWRRPTPPLAELDAATPASESIVAAPVVDDAGNAIAAVYGVRHGRGDNRRRGVRPLEARVIELIADAVAVGMARRRQEVESARHRVLLEQVFSPSLADYLCRHPEALDGQVRDVTLLFADLRGFTAVAERLSPRDAYDLLSTVMETLTQIIMDHGGVVVDYYGDGVSAVWNAPLATPDHADRACAAALRMIDALPLCSRDWQHALSEPLRLSVGLHAGAVHIGNAGARQRIKYGPRGAAVNVASRVQSAARRLDVALLATDAVRRRLSSRFVTLKVCTARLPGIDEPLELVTVFPSTDAERLQGDLERYAEALSAFEEGRLDEAEQQLANLLATGPATPAAFLAQQAAALRQGALGRRASDEFVCTPDAVIEILSK
jgi:adenylate cyclase